MWLQESFATKYLLVEAGRQEGILGYFWGLDKNSCFLEEEIGSGKGIISLYHCGERAPGIPPGFVSLE